MWCSDRRTVIALILGGGLAGCGFRPLYREGDGAAALLGAVSLQEAASPEDFAYRERLRRRLGLTRQQGGSKRYRLIWRLSVDEDGLASTRNAETTRYRLTALARYRLLDLTVDEETESVVTEGTVKTIGAYDATSSVYATRASRRDERARLAVELGELTATRILAAATAGGP